MTHPLRKPVDAGDMADMPNVVIEGGMILARDEGDPQGLMRQGLRWSRRCMRVVRVLPLPALA